MSEYLGSWIRIKHCTQCDWHVRLIWDERCEVCPQCGSELMRTVGRFRFEDRRRIFGQSSEIVGVIYKDKESL